MHVASLHGHGGSWARSHWSVARWPPPAARAHPCALHGQGGSCARSHLSVSRWPAFAAAAKTLRAQDPPCPWDEEVCACAAATDELEILQWLRAQDPPCPWDEEACARAAEHGHLVTLEWLHTNGCPEHGT